ncbi:MAG: hypothetical protein M3O61_13210, partial [Gemmatimonadota bacterium]|nr:hypothetical protein [Gemmatimonadota bacterium]
MASREVDSAYGAAPTRSEKKKSAVDLLAEKRQAIDTARKNYTAAKSARDEQAMSDESRRIDQLKILISELEREAAVEVETAGRTEAENRLLGIKRAYGSTVATYQDD